MTEPIISKYLDFKKTCRGCMLAVECEYILLACNVANKATSIVEQFMSCTSLLVEEEDGLPGILCKKCSTRVEDAFSFRLQCINSDAMLRTYLKIKSSENEGNSIDNRSIKNETTSKNSVCNNFATVSSSNDVKNKYVGLPSKNVHEESKNLSTEDNHSKNASKKVRTKSYSCVECNETFKSLLSFKSHKKNHDKKVEESSSENETVNNANVELINRTNSRDASKVKLTCQVCNKTYLKASNLAAHMGLHTGIKPYQCSICGKKFTQGRAYSCHMRTHGNSTSKPQICSKCDLPFANDSELKAHENEECSPCNSKTTTNPQEPTTQTTTNSNRHICSVCGRNFCNSGNLRAHMRLHTGDRPYSCNICGKKFAQSNAHSYHMKTHLGERPFTCDLCPKAFTTNGQLINHRRLHTGEKPFACKLCPKRFTQKTTYNIHMMYHTGNKPHLCSVCGKKYAQNSQLVEHMRTHNGEKYKCNQCGRTYSTAGNLAAHVRTHSGIKPHSCTVCGKSFYVANKLVKHMRSHSGEKPFLCPVCPKRFTCSGVLTVHLRTHTGERPYVCTVCNKGFTNNSQLTVHAKTHADEHTFGASVNLTSHSRTCVDSMISNVYNASCDIYDMNSKRLYTL